MLTQRLLVHGLRLQLLLPLRQLLQSRRPQPQTLPQTLQRSFKAREAAAAQQHGLSAAAHLGMRLLHLMQQLLQVPLPSTGRLCLVRGRQLCLLLVRMGPSRRAPLSQPATQAGPAMAAAAAWMSSCRWTVAAAAAASRHKLPQRQLLLLELQQQALQGAWHLWR
jgi:hypothetical protein